MVLCGSKCKKSFASKFNREVSLQKFVEGSRDAMGGIGASSYTEVRKIWCSIKSVRGNESFLNSKLTEKVTTVFKTNYLDVQDLLSASNRTEWKLVFDNVSYNIIHVIDIEEMHQTVEIFAYRGDAV